MPKLPEALGTPQDLGAVPPDPSRNIPHYDAGQVGAAMQGFAGDLGASAGQIQDVQDRLARAAAEQDFISKKLDLDQQFASDGDYATAPQRYRQSLLQALNDTSRGILGPAQRAGFQQQMSRFAEVGVDSILRQSVAKARDAGRANVTQATSTAVNDALRTSDETNFNPIFDAINDRIQASLEAGYLSRDEAVALRKGTAQSYVRQRGWRLADADPQQAVDTLKPSALADDGQPSFAKVGDWRDLLDPGERASMVQRAHQNLELQQHAAEVDAVRQQRQQQKADADAAHAIASRYVAQLAADPTSVDVGALARERFPDSQQDTRQALLGAAQTAIARAGDTAAAGYGPGFWQSFNRLMAPDGDPAKISDPVELLKLAGPEGGGALTPQGVQQLQRFLDADKTAEGRAQSAMEQMFLRQAHAQITGTEDVADPAAETRFQNFLGAYFPALDAGLKSGKTAAELLTPASPDSLGKLIPAFAPPPAPSAQDQPDAAATSSRRDKDIETNDNRSLGERAVGALTASAGGMVEQLQGAFQGVSPALTRQLGKRLGSLDQSDSGLVILPDSRGVLDKTTDFDPAKHVFLGHDVYERVPEAEENRLQSLARWFSTALVTGPLSASKGPGGIKAGEAAGEGTRAAEDAATEGRVAGAGEAKASTPVEQAVPDALATREVPGATGGPGASPASVPRVAIGKGEARYVTLGNKEYVALANGNPDLGVIDAPAANAIGREAAPIRLPRATEDGLGEKHINIGKRAEEISAAGYEDPAEFVGDVAQNYSQIWSAKGRALLLVKRVPDLATGQAHSLVVQLEPAADGGAYEVRTAGVFRGNFPAGGDRKLLWQRERANIPPDDTGSQGPFQ